METLTVDLGDRSYPIDIGSDLINDTSRYTRHLNTGQVLIVTNETVAPLYLEQLKTAIPDRESDSIILPDGEEHKTLKTVSLIYDALLQGGYGRDCTLIALGGGVIGDMCGFVAATYQRGVDFIQVPTTLLAQVDSSVGGKTGVNHSLGKNMIGAFHQPQAVIADTNTLKTLPKRELLAGIAEVIKYGLLGDMEFLIWLEGNISALVELDDNALSYAIYRSCENKVSIVAEDEREAGKRALLNLGHTFGHAIEATLGFGEWLHGEAVAAGMAMAADMSCRMGWISETDRDRAITLIAKTGLPTTLPSGITPEQLLASMGHDKKVLAGKLRLVLLKSLGHAIVTADFDPHALHATLEAYCQS